MGGAGNDVRDRCRDLLYNSLKKGLPDGMSTLLCTLFSEYLLLYIVTIEDDTRLFNLAAMIEDNILHNYLWL